MTVPTEREHVALGPLTTLHVGGPARRWVQVSAMESLPAVLARARAMGWPTLVLGDGSNVLVGDDGFDGLVIQIAAARIVFRPNGRALDVWAEAGASWERLVDEAVARGAAGIECLTGIPGRVGAAPIQNIGAYGQELADSVAAVEVVERATGRRFRFAPDACGFGYRTSRFKREEDQWVVTGLQLRLRQGDPPTLRYADLAARATAGGTTPTLRSVRALVRATRADKSMLRVPGDPNFHSAGSFFMNPVVPDAQADRVAEVAAGLTSAPLPRYPAGPGASKLSAAWLIERAGFPRGWSAGRAGLSTRHTLALVNRGGATAADILRAAVEVRDGVLKTFGVALTPEPVLVGVRWPPPNAAGSSG